MLGNQPMAIFRTKSPPQFRKDREAAMARIPNPDVVV
ncbi:unnamed protein product [Prunus brigantina]